PERRTAFLRKQPVFPDVNEHNDFRYPFWGKLTEVKRVPISGVRYDTGEEPFYYRCLVSTKDIQGTEKSIIVCTSFLPSFQINRLGQLADFGRESDKAAKEQNLESGIGEMVGGIGFLMLDESRHEKRPVLCAAHFGWYPESLLLGRLGMDVASFDAVPVFSQQDIARLTHKSNAELSPEVRRQIMSSLRLTKADTDAFYGLLLAGSRAGSPQLFREAKVYLTTMENNPAYCPAVELFNRPQHYQGKLVLLRGHARRVERIPVGDEEIRKRYGIDSYYQIIFFTPDSQGNPLVVCVPQLPQGMPVGSGKQYREEIEVAAFFLKSWAYRGATPKEDQTTISDQKQVNEPLDAASELVETTDKINTAREPKIPWVKAPLLVGGSVRWTPQPASNTSPTPAAVRWTFTAFAALAFLYFSYRLFRRRYSL
ncbi:MAG: hypothetical protein Q4G59_12785, partial [Planctomycetia bacterium]|nr:hypothetical protein [Planctomycetia bacterium]